MNFIDEVNEAIQNAKEDESTALSGCEEYMLSNEKWDDIEHV